ncbi:hypothetical protein AUR64_14385 [Haloprofundus marisrubri]|uniref:Cdc6 AAA+ ATPase-type lid domain-containing protein n=1 Tax=Haloprofundus marisrubri TaxID=1514971 RepID=A0A0W1R6I0_9EURY|nr:orc1/cdc6 family replication initiation protein [Haloprofundus marisrubri]KTG08990.1 hypothetical protein AUR64_14385 [Haloprofundus marisrubri]
MAVHIESSPDLAFLQQLEDTADHPRVAILDEADAVDPEVLYDLFEIPRFVLILVGNREEDLMVSMDTRLQSRFHGARKIEFNRYSVEELIGILKKRAQNAFSTPEFVGDDDLEALAEHVDGDARFGIVLLRTAAEDAVEQGLERITPEIIGEAVSRAKSALRDSLLDSLPDEHRTLYDVIVEHEPIGPTSEIRQLYCKKTGESASTRTIQRYLRVLRNYDCIESEGESQNIVYRSVYP